MIALLLIGCRDLPEGAFGLDFAESTFVPSVSTVTWDGVPGDAALWAVPADEYHARDPHPGERRFEGGGGWRVVSRRPAHDGQDGIPAALLHPGRWFVRAVVDEGDGREVASDVVEHEVDDPPDAVFGGVTPEVEGDPAAVGQGWLVAHQYATKGDAEGSVPLILDAEGRVVWWMRAAPANRRVIRARPTNDRSALWLLLDGPGDDDLLRRVALDGESLEDTPVHDATHDLVEADDGSVAYLAYSYSEDGALAEFPGYPVAADAVDVVVPGSGEPSRRVFDFLRDYPAAPYVACGHVTPNGFVPGAVEWTHGNSLLADPGGDGWWLLARHLDTFVHVGADGGVRWILGGAEATLSPTAPGAVFRHGHASHAWREADGDHLLIFDNRTHDPAPVVSRALELRVDPDAGTYEEVWSFADPRRRNSGFLGDARRLDNGNTLVDFTPFGEVVVVDRAGEVRWWMKTEDPLGRVLVEPLAP